MAAVAESAEIFTSLSSTIGNFNFGRTAGDWNILSKTLDELNTINYKYTVVTNPTKAVLLINQCCSLIPSDDVVLSGKCSQLLYNLVNHQKIIVEGRTLTIAVQWCLNGLKIRDDTIALDVLRALEALLRSNIDNVFVLSSGVTNDINNFLNIKRPKHSPELLLLSLQCLEACTAAPTTHKPKDPYVSLHFGTCGKIFMQYLNKRPNFDDIVYNNVLRVCLKGLQNIVNQDPKYLENELGSILGVIKTYMLYGIKDIDYISSQKILPSTLSIPEAPYSILREKKGGKLTKQRKQKTNKKLNQNAESKPRGDNGSAGYVPATTSLELNSDGSTISVMDTSYRLRTSDSDFSDGDAVRVGKIGPVYNKIRQAALYLFYDVVKNTDKATMFSYWTSFIPEGTMCGQHNLITCVLKDPSIRGRISALGILLLLLTTSKLYLMQAESCEKTTSFTPFSVILGFMLKELHKGLSLALKEKSVPVLTQVLKCFAALVQATPYHRMSQGLITKVVRNVKSFIYYKDATVQVTALIVLGCVLASEPVLPETKEVMLRLTKSKSKQKDTDRSDFSSDGFEYANFSDSECSEPEDEPVDVSTIPWLLKRCLNNLGLKFQSSFSHERNLCAPVKLESLQVLSAMSRNYFDLLMAPHISHIIKGLNISLLDTYTDLRLHAGRAVDFIGQAINRYINSDDSNKLVSMEQCVQFWQKLLNKSLIDLLQCEAGCLRAVACDCLGSIGGQIFEQLPRNKQILCITLLFACTRDEENSVKGAAVRALGIWVLYPSLKEDPGFVVDTAETIHRTLQDESLIVRAKASWSLANLSDALVLNSLSENGSEEITDTLILKLVQAGIAGATDNDKVKMNAVRAIGNLLQLIGSELMTKREFVDVTDQAFTVLVKAITAGSNMKVRWNACYALGSGMKNPALYQHNLYLSTPWQEPVFNSLMELIMGFHNFKVRINSVVALACPAKREHYGQFYVPVWVSLLKALENSHNMEDFNEYKHRDHLVDEVCLALSHLTTLLQKDDLLHLEDTIEVYFDTFKTYTHKVLERLVPEKSAALFATSNTLSTLYKRLDLNTKQKQIVRRLMDIFVPEF